MPTSDDTRQFREFLKDSVRKRVDFRRTDQSQGLPPPPMQKPLPKGATTLALPSPEEFGGLCPADLLTVFRRRRSRRLFAPDALSAVEMSFLLWATQGVRQPDGRQPMLRTVPSAGARHAFETYLVVRAVGGLSPGLYRYLPLGHALFPLDTRRDPSGALCEACFGQDFVGTAAVSLVWTAIPYRMEWRYGLAAHRVIAIDVGHVCQNLYLACEGIGLGTCAVGAYDQEAVDSLLGVDGEDEFTLYLAPVGRIPRESSLQG